MTFVGGGQAASGREVLEIELPSIQALRARRPERLPVVLSVGEIRQVLAELDGIDLLMAEILYGTGMRILECCRLRVKDVDFARRQIVVREGKGDKDRVAPLPGRVADRLRAQVERVKQQHARDVRAGHGRVWLPHALQVKYPRADRELGWQYLFPSSRLSEDPRANQYDEGEPLTPNPSPPGGEGSVLMRHHRHENLLQKRVKAAVQRTGLTKKASCFVAAACFSFAVRNRCLLYSGRPGMRHFLGSRNMF